MMLLDKNSNYLVSRPDYLDELESIIKPVGYKRHTTRQIARRVAKLWESLEYLHVYANDPWNNNQEVKDEYVASYAAIIERMRSELTNMLGFQRPWNNIDPKGGRGRLGQRGAPMLQFSRLRGDRPLWPDWEHNVSPTLPMP